MSCTDRTTSSEEFFCGGSGAAAGEGSRTPGPPADPQKHSPSPCPALDPELGEQCPTGRRDECPSQNSEAFCSERFPRHVEQPREEIPVAAAVGSGEFSSLSLREDQSQPRGSGVRETREGIPHGCPTSAPLLSTAGPSRAPEGCGLRATAFPAIGSDFLTLVLFQPTLHLHFICEGPRCLGRVRTRRPVPHSGRAGRANLFLLMILPCRRS